MFSARSAPSIFPTANPPNRRRSALPVSVCTAVYEADGLGLKLFLIQNNFVPFAVHLGLAVMPRPLTVGVRSSPNDPIEALEIGAPTGLPTRELEAAVRCGQAPS